MAAMAHAAERKQRLSYTAVADRLELEIAALAPHDKVASENELAARFGVSRVTTRSALQELERRMVVRRVRGSGTFVLPRLSYVLSSDGAPSWRAAVRDQGHEPGVAVLSCTTAPASPATQRALRTEAGDDVVHVVRLGTVDGLTAAMSEHWLPLTVVGSAMEQIANGGSLRTAIIRNGCRPARREAAAEMDTAPPEVGARLGLDHRALVWHVESTSECRDCGRIVESTRAWMRVDMFRLRFELPGETCPPDRPRTEQGTTS
jgi:DNA-binding GntR family transcriptional regulator